MFRGDLNLPQGVEQPSALPITPEHAIRWMSARNMFNDWVPPFACTMMHDFEEGGKPYGTFDNGEDDFWKLTQCNELGSQLQNPAVFFFNGPTAIPPHPHGWGRVTRDYPARVLHPCGGDINTVLGGSLGPSMPCGPVKDKWYVSGAGSAWTCMGHRETDIKIPGYHPKKLHTVWVTGERTKQNSDYASDTIGILTVSTGEAFGFPLSIKSRDVLTYDSTTKKFTLKKGLTEAIFLASFGATIYSPSAPRGAQLIVSMTHRRKSGATRKTYKAMREQDIEVDGYGSQILQTTKENVAMTAILDLQAEDTIELTNESAHSLSLLHVNICFGQLGSAGFLKDTTE